jgi:hypothetical protein
MTLRFFRVDLSAFSRDHRDSTKTFRQKKGRKKAAKKNFAVTKKAKKK